MTVNDEIVAVLRRFTKAFREFDADGLVATFDSKADGIVYQPEELLEPIFTIEGLRSYAVNLPTVVKAMRDVKVLDLKVEQLGDVALVYVRFWCRISFSRVPRSADGQIRQSFVLCRDDGEWRIRSYHESRQAAGMEAAVGDW